MRKMLVGTLLGLCLSFLYCVGVDEEPFLKNPKYLSNDEAMELFEELKMLYPNLTDYQSIGKSVHGRDLWVIRLSSDVGLPNRSSLKPMFKYVANIYGDEAVGRELLIFLAQYLVENYSSNSRVKQLLDTVDIYLIPSLNPDGFASSEEGSCDSKWGFTGRNNGNMVDLDRDFPDQFDTDADYANVTRQPETLAMMQWILQNSFVLSGNLLCGAVVASYPHDDTRQCHGEDCHESKSPDDSLFEKLASTYAHLNPQMHAGNACQSDNLTNSEGITNGTFRYEVKGGMQDFNYVNRSCMEVTFAVSCCKFPNASELPTYWENNKESLISFMEAARWGVKGYVTDVNLYLPIPYAEIQTKGIEHNVTANKNGEYWRLLLPGKYEIRASVPGYGESSWQEVIIPEGHYETVIVNFTITDIKAEASLGLSPQTSLSLAFIPSLPASLRTYKEQVYEIYVQSGIIKISKLADCIQKLQEELTPPPTKPEVCVYLNYQHLMAMVPAVKLEPFKKVPAQPGNCVLPKLYCVKPIEKLAKHVWTTAEVYISINTDLYDIYLGCSDIDVMQNFIRNHKTLMSTNSIRLHPFNASCLGIITTKDYEMELDVDTFNKWRQLMSCAGAVLFYMAPIFAQDPLIQFLSAVTGLFVLSVAILVSFLLTIALPKIPSIYDVILTVAFGDGGWSMSETRDWTQSILTSFVARHGLFCIVYVVASGLGSWLFCYICGPVRQPLVHYILVYGLEILIQVVGLLIAYHSSDHSELVFKICMFNFSYGIYVTQVFTVCYELLSSMVVRLWNLIRRLLRLFPSRRALEHPPLLTQQEYRDQGKLETRRALEELRATLQRDGLVAFAETLCRLSPAARDRIPLLVASNQHVTQEARDEHRRRFGDEGQGQ